MEGLGDAQSALLLWGLVIAFSAAGVALTWGRRRNGLSLYVNLALPFEAHAVLSHWPGMKLPLAGAMAAAGTAAIACFLLALFRRARSGERRGFVLLRSIRHGLLGGRTAAAVCLSLLLIPLGVKAVFERELLRPTVAPALAAEEHTIADHLDELRSLEEDAWETLDAEARLNLLQTVANIEDTYLGLPHELKVEAGNLDESVVGQYNDRTHTITVSADALLTRPAAEILDTLCHEAYHAYQHRLCDAYDSLDSDYKGLLLFYKAETYTDEFENYYDGDDFEVYYSQRVEVDCRNYAAGAVEDYYAKIAGD
ncbi:MAG TPA: hypothetical protein VN446_02265 [Candidatus Acidoferrum sp.]|nr:hypothetical protein [Candidatus Acidoferrum sp.]